MGFNKRFIKKEIILNNIDNPSYIEGLVKGDALIMDTWSKNFFDNFDLKWKIYNSLREKLNNDFIYSSNKLEHDDYPKLKKLSNVLINLKTNPSWVDIILAGELLKQKNDEIPNIGKFKSLVNYYIKLIESQYDN